MLWLEDEVILGTWTEGLGDSLAARIA